MEVRLKGMDQFGGQEIEIFQRLGLGLGTGDVADPMDLSRKTVESYFERMQ